jgi:hypothetical protein
VVLDGSLGDAILEVGIYATKVELLSRIMACLLEGIVMKSPVIAVVVEDLHSIFSHILLKGKLSSECFCRRIVKLEVDKVEAAVVVDKDGGALVVLLGKVAFQLHVETHFSGRHLVNGDTLSSLVAMKTL